MSDQPLTENDAMNLSMIIAAARKGAKVAWVSDGGDSLYGHARHIVKSPDNFGFLNGDEDVRDGYLRITMKSGFERTISVRELMSMVALGEFVEYDW
jgi:hypothetical protein